MKRGFLKAIAVLFGIVILGNVSMMANGEFNSGWNYFALVLFILIEIGALIGLTKIKKIPRNN